MSKCLFIGCEQSKGEYNGSAYDNFLLYLTAPLEMGKGVGNKVCLVSTSKGKTVPKVKSSEFANVFGQPASSDFLNGLVGQLVEVSFNMYGNIERVSSSK